MGKLILIRRLLICFVVYFVLKSIGVFVYQNYIYEPPPKPKQYRVVNGQIKPNEPLFNSLTAQNISPQESIKLVSSFEGVKDLRFIQPGDSYRAYLEEDNSVHKFIYQSSTYNVYISVATQNKMVAFRKPVYINKRIVSKVLDLETSVYEAFLKAGETDTLAYYFAEIFSWDIDFYLFPQKGDQLVILYERYEDDDGGLVKYGDILSAKYYSKRKSYQAYRFEDKRGRSSFYALNGKPMEKMFLKMPLKLGYLSSHFSWRRFHPILKRYRPHTGVDYASSHGSPIISTADGVVIFAGWKGGYGNLVQVRHANRYVSYYGHCSRILVRKGQYVKQGQRIARVGSTGNSTGPHVHYEIRANGRIVNPERFNTIKGYPIAKKDKKQFAMRMNNFNNLIAKPPSYEEPDPEPPTSADKFWLVVGKGGRFVKRILWV